MGSSRLRVRPHKAFRLPFLGRNAFKQLMEAGLVYDGKKRCFFVDLLTDLSRVNAVLRENLGWEMEEEVGCVVCGEEVYCNSCLFKGCVQVGYTCICLKCMERKDLFHEYVRAQNASLTL